MKKSAAAILVLSWVLCTGANAQSDDWGQALQWVDKYPSDKLGANGGGLFDQPLFKSILSRVLPKAEATALSKFAIESVIQKVGDYVIVHKCLPHDCPTEMATVIIDVKTRQLWVALFSREAGRTSTRWYATADDYSTLPDKIKNDFLQRQRM
jgi:hypothetical protein